MNRHQYCRIAGIFLFFTYSCHGHNFYPVNFLSHVSDYIEPVVTFVAWVKIYSTEYFCSTGVAGLDEFLSSKIFICTVYADAASDESIEPVVQ